MKKIVNRLRINRLTAMNLVSPFFGTLCSELLIMFLLIGRQLSNAAVRQFARLCVCLSRAISHEWCIGYGYYRKLIGNPTLEIEPTGRRGRIRPPQVAKTGGGRSFQWYRGDTLYQSWNTELFISRIASTAGCARCGLLLQTLRRSMVSVCVFVFVRWAHG